MNSLTTEQILVEARSRMIATAPTHEQAIGRWYDSNRERLSPWARVVLGTATRLGQSLQSGAASAIVSQLVGRLEKANPPEGAWGRRYQSLLELLVRVIIDTAQPAPALLAMAKVVLPTLASERTRINVLAAKIAISEQPATEQALDILRRFTGFGGLSLERVAREIPPELLPDSKSLVDEYYTPTKVCEATAAVIAALSGGLDGPALEPAAGVGRFVGAFAARPDMAALRWTAVEYSVLSSRILAKLHPYAKVVNAPFEQWIVENFNEVAGRLALAVTNPPYGKRGKNKTLDPDKTYREELAYVYFIRRSFDLLRAGGLGVALVPNGFLTGKTPGHARVRAKVLVRHHLLCAYRLPSSIYPGAEIVTDLSFWRARGGELESINSSDDFVVAGEYFKLYPNNILGQEETSARGRYQVKGDFTALPTLETREDCAACSVKPFIRAFAPKVVPEENLEPRLKVALVLAKRVSDYLDLSASTAERDKQRAADLHVELVAAAADWLSYNRQDVGQYTPSKDRELSRAANDVSALAALLSVFTPAGELKPEFLAPPRFEPTYQGLATISAHAEWLFAKRRQLRIPDLRSFRASLGMPEEQAADLELELIAQGWCEDWPDDGSVWIPAAEYYSGDLWPRLRRARASSSPRAIIQIARIKERIGVVTLEDASPTLRDSWVPAEVSHAFLTDVLKIEVPELHWFRALLKPVGMEYSEIHRLDKSLQIALGYINHDLGYFDPEYSKNTDPATGDEETAQKALDRVRLEYGTVKTRELREWLASHPEMTDRVLEAYGGRFRGYVPPNYGTEPIPIARWGKRITLKTHQRAGAWRLIRNNGGLLAFDVGVGKTYTGIATLAYLRQIGRARRPIVIVPNSIIWKWSNELLRALPDYRVVVIGSERYLGQGGVPRSRLDEKRERLQKWSEFKLGLYDVALVTYSVFAKTGISEESLRLFLEETPTLLRDVGLKTADLEEELEKLAASYRERNELSDRIGRLQAAGGDEAKRTENKKSVEQLQKKAERLDKRLARLQTISDRLVSARNPSERNRAILQESINEWIAEVTEGQDSDGIDFESLRCDLLMLDEAQNMKNLWPVGRREGGVPKYLGAITEGSERAYSFAFRAFLVQKETGGSGVVLLSATPAKNSPLEFFTLLGYVDHYAWTRRGVLDPDYFIDRYLKLEMRSSLKPDGSVENRTAVVGFMALNELRDIVFKYGDFKTAVEVGIKLPESKSRREFLQMNDSQRSKYRRLRQEYEDIVSSREGMREKHKLLGLLQKMGLVALHPELEVQPKDGWTWASAGRLVGDPASPKLTRAVEICRERPECGHIVFADNVAVHRWLFDLLVSSGVPAERIAVLNAEKTKTPLQRQEVADGFNGVAAIIDSETGRIEQDGVPPKFDIVIANAIAYEGIDLQIRTCRVIHLDLPYEPATLQQRNGRAVRQFNTESVVEIIYLLSDKSYDAVKLTMITGKLRWMSDILKGTDRETNNPAAEMDLNSEDLLLMLADDPEAAKQAMEVIRLRNEAERNAQAAFQAWLRVSQLIALVSRIERTQDESEKEQARREAIAAQTYLRDVPQAIWPWSFVADKILAGVPTQTVSLLENGKYSFRAIWEGLSVPIGAGRRAYFGAVRNGGFSYREDGSHTWVRAEHAPESWALLAQVPPPAYLEDAPDDSARWEASLQNAISDLRYVGGIKSLGLYQAPDYWSADVWKRYGKTIAVELHQRGTEVSYRQEDTVAFGPAIADRWADFLPPTDAGYAELLNRVANGRFTYSAMQEQTKAWWGREFPRGVADDRALLVVEKPDGSSERVRIVSSYKQILSVVQPPESSLTDDSWAIADLETRRLLDLEPFGNVDNAKLAARWLAELASDEDKVTLNAQRRSVVRWIAEQSDLPTLANVQARYAAEKL